MLLKLSLTALVVAALSVLSLPLSAADTRAVLITGASSGIGLRTAEVLSSSGFYVYAGARKQIDMDALNKLDNVEAVRLDVTKQADIDAAVEQVRKGGRGLHGVVNNAGVAIVGPLAEVNEADLDFIFNVNIYGPYRITQAFLPALIKSKGRVVNISSISGVLSGPLLGPYSMTKHALEAFNDSLAAEMVSFGVHVAAVEPGNYASRIGDSEINRMAVNGDSLEGSAYEKQVKATAARLADRKQMADPIAVARAVEHALSAETPQARYMVVPNQREAEITIRKIIRELAELNQNQPHSYDRDTLVKMLDEQLAALEVAPQQSESRETSR